MPTQDTAVDLRRLVQVWCTPADGSAPRVGTGWFVTAHLVLTADHVLPPGGAAAIAVRTEADKRLRSVAAEHLQPVWRNALLDAALLRVDDGLDGAIQTDLDASPPDPNAAWHTLAYPRAGAVPDGAQHDWLTVSLSGQVSAQGGRGVNLQALELTVSSPPKQAEDWSGASGAPVFVGQRLIGVLRSAPTAFAGGRLYATPFSALLRDIDVRRLLATPASAEDDLPHQPWLLVVQAEGQNDVLADWVRNALRKHGAEIVDAVGDDAVLDAARSLRVVAINDALASGGRWLALVRALCAAPIALFDVTGFQPGVMLALGVRAVVRRGVTLASSAERLDAAPDLRQASDGVALAAAPGKPALPFNIQELKLICHGAGFDPKDAAYPPRRIAAAIAAGCRELVGLPRYLDLPAYDAVRVTRSDQWLDSDGRDRRVLMLCPFDPRWRRNWLHLAEAIDLATGLDAARMLDVGSPRLVGQALYEGIRWARYCIVDASGWRPNVFFEFGVRLACSAEAPLLLVDRGSALSADQAPLVQHALIESLWPPLAYDPSLRNAPGDALRQALALHQQQLGQPGKPPPGALARDATHRMCARGFDSQQEAFTLAPHEALARGIAQTVGEDVQASGRNDVLFADEPAFNAAVREAVRERWLAAWFYLEQRWDAHQRDSDQALRATLARVAGEVLQSALRGNQTDPTLQAVRERVLAAFLRLRGTLADSALVLSPRERLALIVPLKTEAKTLRSQGADSFQAALKLLHQAVDIARDGLQAAGADALRSRLEDELADCLGICGGIERRWADADPDATQRGDHLAAACRAYDDGLRYETRRYAMAPQHEARPPARSYNLVNRLTTRLLLRPDALQATAAVDFGHRLGPLHLRAELNAARDDIDRHLARKGDVWADADLALLELLLGDAQTDVAAVYAPVLGRPQEAYVFDSMRDGLRPLAALPTAAAPALAQALALLDAAGAR